MSVEGLLVALLPVSATNAATRARAVGCLRALVGLVMIAAPKAVARIGAEGEPTGSFSLLMRTVGIRDLVLGIGTVAAAQAGVDETRRWIGMGLLSDALDSATGAVSGSLVGRRSALTAAAIPVPVIVADLWALAGSPAQSSSVD